MFDVAAAKPSIEQATQIVIVYPSSSFCFARIDGIRPAPCYTFVSLVLAQSLANILQEYIGHNAFWTVKKVSAS